MNNIVFIKTPTFIVNDYGKLSESLRPDENKGLRKVIVETRNFDSLSSALSWVNNESFKTTTTLFLYEIRPAAHGYYNVRAAICPNKTIAKKSNLITKKRNTISKKDTVA
jgi:hypothetical protein